MLQSWEFSNFNSACLLISWYTADGSISVYILLGVTLHYFQVHIILWMFVRVAATFWGIRFPFHAQTFTATKTFKYIHFAIVLAVFMLPTISVIIIATSGGFKIVNFPPQFCQGRNEDAVFYSAIFPVILMSLIAAPLVVNTFWVVHKVDHNSWLNNILLHSPTKCPSMMECCTIRQSIHPIFQYHMQLL